MINKIQVEEMIKYVQWHSACGGEPPSEWWDEFLLIFTEDVDETIEFLTGCNEEEIHCMSQIFEEISSGLQSYKFIEFIKSLQKKFPNIKMELSIYWAEQAIQED